MSHPNEELLRRVYANFSQGKMAEVLADCTDDIVFHVPGQNQVSGDHTRGDFPAFIGKVMELTHGTFREDVHDIIVNDEHGAALLTHRLERDGKHIEYKTVHVWHLRGGKCAEWWECPHATTRFDEAYA